MTIRSLGILTLFQSETEIHAPVKALIDFHMSANEPQTLRNEYSRATEILDAEYDPASLDDVIKICENLHVEEQHQFTLDDVIKICENLHVEEQHQLKEHYSKNMNICLMEY
jgi:hypothetical protein